MKVNLALRAIAAAAATALVAVGLSAGALAPASAATKSTVTLMSQGEITSLNSGTTKGNTAYNQMPAGAIMAWGSDTAPSNWLICDGSAVSRSLYASLYAAIGDAYGAGDGTP